jgi:stage II sporulation protein AA (anti-sigma F factor antagonist)
MIVNFALKKNILIIRLRCDLDHHNTEKVRDVIDYNIEKKEVRHVLFNMEDVRFIDSSGIGLILGRYKKVVAKEGRIAFIHITHDISKMLKLSGIFLLTKVYDNEKEALIQLGKGDEI